MQDYKFWSGVALTVIGIIGVIVAFYYLFADTTESTTPYKLLGVFGGIAVGVLGVYISFQCYKSDALINDVNVSQ